LNNIDDEVNQMINLSNDVFDNIDPPKKETKKPKKNKPAEL